MKLDRKIKPGKCEAKEEIAKDLEVILDAKISPKMKARVCNLVTWAWAELPGKKSKANYWSRRALEDQSKLGIKLVFEHVVPRKIVIERLLGLESATKEEITKVLNKFCFGCVITKDEDIRLNRAGWREKMPPDWEKNDDVWARYKIVMPAIEPVPPA